jgi:hypothetical protein
MRIINSLRQFESFERERDELQAYRAGVDSLDHILTTVKALDKN